MNRWALATGLFAILFVVEQWLAIGYIWKVLLKIVFMLGVPLLFVRPDWKKLFVFKKSNFWWSLSLCFAFIIILVGAFIVLESHIDLENIKTELLKKQGLSAGMFILVSFYIIFGNAVMEEYFFRYFLVREQPKWAPYASSLLFSIYHMTIFLGWFSWYILAVVLVGLALGGFIFCQLNRGTHTFLYSWIAHIGADIGIIIIGFHMFGYF